LFYLLHPCSRTFPRRGKGILACARMTNILNSSQLIGINQF
jgi:hypothetical protein